MSADLKVWYSEVMQAERDFNNLARSSTASTDYSDTTLSVRDARKRFEQMSSSPISTPTGQRKSDLSISGSSPRRPPPPRPMKKRTTDSEICMLSTANSKGTPNAGLRGQSSGIQGANEDVNRRLEGQDFSAAASKPKRSLKKAFSARPNDLVSRSETDSPTSPERKSVGSKKLFKRMSMEKTKVDTNSESASNGSARGSSKKGGASQNMASSPTHKKTSPLASMKKKLSSDSKSNSDQPSSPVNKAGKRGFHKSISDQVLVSPGSRKVQASLGDEDRGKVVGGSRPAAPRVIEDGELKLNLAKGTKQAFAS